MLDLFDGACDLDSDDASGYSSSYVPNAEFADSECNAHDESHDFSMPYSNEHEDASSQNFTSADYSADQCFVPPFSLDGSDYEYSRMVYDQYDQAGIQD